MSASKKGKENAQSSYSSAQPSGSNNGHSSMHYEESLDSELGLDPHWYPPGVFDSTADETDPFADIWAAEDYSHAVFGPKGTFEAFAASQALINQQIQSQQQDGNNLHGPINSHSANPNKPTRANDSPKASSPSTAQTSDDELLALLPPPRHNILISMSSIDPLPSNWDGEQDDYVIFMRHSRIVLPQFKSPESIYKSVIISWGFQGDFFPAFLKRLETLSKESRQGKLALPLIERKEYWWMMSPLESPCRRQTPNRAAKGREFGGRARVV